MADTLTTQSGTLATVPASTVIATDDAGASGHVQIVKLALSTDGSASPITADANGLEVQGAGVAGTPAGGVVSVQGVSGGTALPVSDNGGSLTVDGTVAVSGTVTVDGSGVTQPVSAASLPLPTGAATSANQSTANTALAAIQTAVETLDNAVSGTELQVDVVSSALPTGAATAAKQPALGTAGSASADVITVQGIASMTALKVDGSGVTQPVSDGGGSLTVDGTVAVSGSVAVTNAGTFATQVDGAALTALQLIDNVVLAEDAAHVSGDAGVMALAVRKDSGAAIAGTDGDYTPLQVDSSGNLRVNIAAGAAAGGTSATDEAAYTPASSAGTPIMGAADETSPDAAAEGTLAIIRSTLNRALHVNLRDASGAEVSVGGGTQYDEDAAHSTGNKVTAAGVVRKDTAASLAGTDGDYSIPIVDANGKLWVNAGGVTLTVDGSGVTQPVSHAALTELAAAINASSQVDVNIAASGATVPVSHAALTELAAAIDTELQVDVVGALPAGDNNIGNVDVASVPAPLSTTGGGTEAAALRVTVASDSTGVLSVDDNGASLTVDNAALSVTGGGVEASALRVTIASDSTGVVSVDDNGSSLTVDNGGTFIVQPRPETSGGLSVFRSLDLDETEEDVKTSAGQVYGYHFVNRTTSALYLKFYNATAANVTVGTTTPVLTLELPANASDHIAGHVFSTHGIAFDTAISVAVTTGFADNDTGAPGANHAIVHVFYK